MYVDFCLLDSRVSATTLNQSPYHAYQVGQPVTYLEPSGIYLLLFGRSVDGQSVVVEAALRSGLTLSFLDEHDSAMSDDLYAQTVEEELKQRACANQSELADNVDLTTRIVRKPCFYGFEPDSHDPLSPRIRRVVELSTHSLKLHRALRRAAEHALHDEPLDCGARPCEWADALQRRGKRGGVPVGVPREQPVNVGGAQRRAQSAPAGAPDARGHHTAERLAKVLAAALREGHVLLERGRQAQRARDGGGEARHPQVVSPRVLRRQEEQEQVRVARARGGEVQREEAAQDGRAQVGGGRGTARLGAHLEGFEAPAQRAEGRRRRYSAGLGL